MPHFQRCRAARRARIESARKRTEQPYQDPASANLLWLPSIATCPIVLYVRATTRKMKREGRLDDQRRDALRRAKAWGATKQNKLLLRVFMGVESGKPGACRPKLEAAAKYALDRSAVLVVIERSRILRPSNFNGRWEYESPTASDWEQLEDRFPCQKASFEMPDLCALEARKFQISRGQKQGKGGRPKGPPNPLQRKASRLRRKGLSFAQIGAQLGISKTTAYRWSGI